MKNLGCGKQVDLQVRILCGLSTASPFIHCSDDALILYLAEIQKSRLFCSEISELL